MAIRMRDDRNGGSNDDYNDNNDNSGNNRGNMPGGGSLLMLLPLLLRLFKGKGLIFLLVIGVGGWFLLRNSGCNIGGITESLFSQSGYRFDAAQYNKASVYEGLADDNVKNPLPEAVSLLRFAPARGQQGQQGSCVAWSSAYAARTILESAATGANPNQIKFSPSFMYNQIGLEGCQGSYIQYAMEQMSKQGALPLAQFPYNENDCSRQPTGTDKAAAGQYKIYGFTRLTNGDNVNSVSVRSVKEHLAKDAPVVIGMMVGQSFMQNMMGRELWQPQAMDASQIGMGGHAMCVIGYDDRKFGGAFQIMNSWGPEWGKDGIGWVRYADFSDYVREAYGIDPLPKRATVASLPLECNIGLVNNADKNYIQLKSTGGNSFNTVTPIKAGTSFKIEVKNSTECYIYIFGAEADGRSYVLFPYLKPGATQSAHSPYFGITGYRLFPKDQSLEADDVGNKDYLAIVTSKSALDYNKINNLILQSAKTSYLEKVNDALKADVIPGVTFNHTNNGTVYFKANPQANKLVVTTIAFDKVK